MACAIDTTTTAVAKARTGARSFTLRTRRSAQPLTLSLETTREQIHLRPTLTASLRFPYFDGGKALPQILDQRLEIPTRKVAPGAAGLLGEIQSKFNQMHRPIMVDIRHPGQVWGNVGHYKLGQSSSQHRHSSRRKDLVIAEVSRNQTPVMLSIGKMSIATILPRPCSSLAAS
jgi:hypothetical protein